MQPNFLFDARRPRRWIRWLPSHEGKADISRFKWILGCTVSSAMARNNWNQPGSQSSLHVQLGISLIGLTTRSLHVAICQARNGWFVFFHIPPKDSGGKKESNAKLFCCIQDGGLWATDPNHSHNETLGRKGQTTTLRLGLHKERQQMRQLDPKRNRTNYTAPQRNCYLAQGRWTQNTAVLSTVTVTSVHVSTVAGAPEVHDHHSRPHRC